MTFIEVVSGIFPYDEEILEFFKQHTQRIVAKKNDVISTNGSMNKNVYFVEKGLLRSFYYENGKDITTNFYIEGKVFANVDTLFNDLPTKYNIEALEDCEVIFCNYQILEELCEKSLSVANFGRYILGRLMAQMSERISSLQYMTAREKYEQLLNDHPDIILRAPLGMIATYLGISQETLSRIRSAK